MRYRTKGVMGKAGNSVDLEHPIYGKLSQTGLLVHLSETPGHIARPEPALGQHMAEVLGELGMTASK